MAARGAQPAGSRHGTGWLEHQSKQRRRSVLSRSMPPSRVVERVEPFPGSDMSHPCTTRRWCRKCRCRTHAQSSPGRNSSFLRSLATLQMYFSESVSGGSRPSPRTYVMHQAGSGAGVHGGRGSTCCGHQTRHNCCLRLHWRSLHASGWSVEGLEAALVRYSHGTSIYEGRAEGYVDNDENEARERRRSEHNLQPSL